MLRNYSLSSSGDVPGRCVAVMRHDTKTSALKPADARVLDIYEDPRTLALVGTVQTGFK